MLQYFAPLSPDCALFGCQAGHVLLVVRDLFLKFRFYFVKLQQMKELSVLCLDVDEGVIRLESDLFFSTRTSVDVDEDVIR